MCLSMCFTKWQDMRNSEEPNYGEIAPTIPLRNTENDLAQLKQQRYTYFLTKTKKTLLNASKYYKLARCLVVRTYKTCEII